MKPRTKKIIIVTAAVAAVALLVWLAVRTKVSASSLIESLEADSGTKESVKGHLSEATSTQIEQWMRQWEVSRVKAKALEAVSIALDAGEITLAVYNKLTSQIINS